MISQVLVHISQSFKVESTQSIYSMVLVSGLLVEMYLTIKYSCIQYSFFMVFTDCMKMGALCGS